MCQEAKRSILHEVSAHRYGTQANYGGREQSITTMERIFKDPSKISRSRKRSG